jgi:hypothetical protein
MAQNLRQVWLDGANLGTDVVAIAVPAMATNFSIGRRSKLAPDHYFAGDIGHAGFWIVNLGAVDVASMAARFNPLHVNGGSIISYHPINGRSPEPSIRDAAVPFGMTVNGAPPYVEEPPQFQTILAP